MLSKTQSMPYSHSEIIRQISALDEKYTPERAQKAIHHYVQENGKFAKEIQEISKFFNKKNVRNLYIPISIYGLDCEEKHLMPAIDMIKSAANQKDFIENDETIVETIKPVKKVVKEQSEIKDSSIGNFEALLDSIIFENVTVHQHDIQKLFTFEGSKTLKQYVQRKKESFQEEYENYPEYYTNIPKRMFNKIIKFYEEVLDTSVKTTKKVNPVKKLPKVRRNLIKALEKFKYAKEINAELGIKSLHPSKVENSNIAILYDVEKTKLFVLHSEYGSKLQIKGTTIYNVNFEKSFKINIRNFKKVFPNSTQEYFSNIKNKDKILDSINKINAKQLKITASRSNDSMYILSAF